MHVKLISVSQSLKHENAEKHNVFGSWKEMDA